MRIAAIWVCGVLLIGCAPKRFDLPTDPGTPLAGVADIHTQISSACAGVRSMTAELGLSGRAGDQRLRGRVLAGFRRPSAMRLEAVVAGQVIFILATPGERAVLYLPRQDRVLRNQPPDAMLAALTGVNLAPADLQAILTGCVVPDGRAVGGRLYNNGLASIDLDGVATLYLQRDGAEWRLRAARRGPWRIDYPAWQGPFPTSVRLLSEASEAPVDLTATIAQLDTAVELGSDAFVVNVPPDADPITLDELRSSGPFRDRPGPPKPGGGG